MRTLLLPVLVSLFGGCITPPGELPRGADTDANSDDASMMLEDMSAADVATARDMGGRADTAIADAGSTDADTTDADSTDADRREDAGVGVRLPFVISAGTVKQDLAEFPVLVRFSSAELADFGWRTNEFSFADADMRPIPYDIESYVGRSGTLRAWVRVPLVESADDTTFYLVPQASNPSFRDVWAGYGGVWHFQSIPQNQTHFADRSENQNHGAPENGAGVEEGKIGPALSLDGVSQYVRVPSDASFKPAEFTISVWLRLNDKGVLVTPVSVPYGAGGANSYQIWVDSSFTYKSWVIHDGAGFSSGAGTVANGDWSHVVLRYDGQAKTQFIDGSEVDSIAAVGTISYDGSDLLIGADRDSGQLRHFVLGRMDELRIASSALSDARIAAEYANQNDPAAFTAVGSFETY